MKNGIHADKSKRELYRKYEVKRIICKILLLNKGLSNELKKSNLKNCPNCRGIVQSLESKIIVY